MSNMEVRRPELVAEQRAPTHRYAGAVPDASSSTLSSSMQDYLKVIWTSQEWDDTPVSSKALADRLGVTASTVSETLKKLAAQGLVDHQRYGTVTLTPSGRRAALAMVRRHRL